MGLMPASKYQSLAEMLEHKIVERNLEPCREAACKSGGLCERHQKDFIFNRAAQPLFVCWSLSESQPFRGELPTATEELKELVKQEAFVVEDKIKRARAASGVRFMPCGTEGR